MLVAAHHHRHPGVDRFNFNADDTTFREKESPHPRAPVHFVSLRNDAQGKALAGKFPILFAKGAKQVPRSKLGQPDDSLLIEKITGKKPEMPKTGNPLSPEEVAAIKHWIKAGRDLARRGRSPGS